MCYIGKKKVLVLVTILLLLQNAMVKATYKREHLVWSSQFHRVRVHEYHGREHGRRQGDMA